MSYSPLDVLGHIRDEARFLIGLADRHSAESFHADEVAKRAAARSIEILGEATKKRPRGLRARHPEVSWSLMTGMRDRAIHDYVGVDYDIVWEVCTQHAPVLLAQIERVIMAEHGTEQG
jgi:uncharacterized protein with HEPN domain